MTTPAPALRLHLPDEPTARRDEWYARVLDGEDLVDVVRAEGGVAAWLYSRWQALDAAGVSRDAFDAQALAYRRELWLWLHGDRTWEQCCSGLIGRIERHAVAPAPTAG
jgi:hypothetical protein